MGSADIANIFNTLDTLTDNQLRMVRAYAADELSNRATARGMARRALQNAPQVVLQNPGGEATASKRGADHT